MIDNRGRTLASPVLSATLLSWVGALPGMSLPHGTLWYVLGYRGLLCIASGTWYIDGGLVGRLAATAGTIGIPEGEPDYTGEKCPEPEADEPEGATPPPGGG